MEFTHFDAQGNARMVDVSGKSVTARTAVAEGTIQVSPEVFHAIEQKTVKKGDVLTVAQVAGILGCKRTSELIPMCHLLNLTNATLTFELLPESCEVRAVCTVKTDGKTGVEMEALTGVSVALLTIYDMCKAIEERRFLFSGGRDMKLIWKLLFGKPKKTEKPKKEKKDLRLTLLDSLVGAALKALSAKWNKDLWKPDF